MSVDLPIPKWQKLERCNHTLVRSLAMAKPME